MKMSDVFDGELVQDADTLFANGYGELADFSGYKKEARYVAHAINNHDRMADEIAELREALTQSTEMLGNFWSNTGSLGALSQKELNEKVLAKHK